MQETQTDAKAVNKPESRQPGKTNSERIKEITATIETGIKELFQSDKYKQYLSTMSRFHKYSVNNTMLIYMQKPDATLVASFGRWRDKFGRSVMKGEKGIKIIAPAPYSKRLEQEMLDPDTKLPLLDRNGDPIMEEKTIKVPAYKIVTVFDVGQTTGQPLPMLAEDVTGDVKNYDVFMEALKRTAPVPLTIEPMRGMDGYFSETEQRIAIREGMSEAQTVCAAIHETAHSLLHNKKLRTGPEAEPEAVNKAHTRSEEEITAESIAYAVSAYYGVKTGDNSMGYIASWSKDKELPELRAALETINSTASELITGIDRHYAAIMKERGLDMDIEEPGAAEITPSSEPSASEPSTSESANEPITSEPTRSATSGSEPNRPATNGPDKQAVHKASARAPFPAGEVERQFFFAERDSIAIYQLRHDAPRELFFTSYKELKAPPVFENYEALYTQTVPPGAVMSTLEDAYMRFNTERPEDFAGHSLSVSDIIALKRGDNVTFHYCDSIGFKQLPGFMPPSCISPDLAPHENKPENALKNAEMTLEDDYDMLDGMINNAAKQPIVAQLERQADSESISLMEPAVASKREMAVRKQYSSESPARPSLLERLKTRDSFSAKAADRPATALKKSAEMER